MGYLIYMEGQSPGGPPTSIETVRKNFTVEAPTSDQIKNAALSPTEMDKITADLESAGVISQSTEVPKTLEEANRRLGETGSGMIKDIIKSKETQGNYFAQFGFEKSDPATQQAGEDMTMIVFPVPFKREGDGEANRFLALTRDGPKEIRPKDVNGFKEMVLARVKYPQVNAGEGYDGDRRNITLMPVDSAGTVSRMPFGEDETFGQVEDMDLLDSGVSSTVQRVIGENIQASEAPIKKVVQQTAEMGNLRNFVQKLPPRE